MFQFLSLILLRQLKLFFLFLPTMLLSHILSHILHFIHIDFICMFITIITLCKRAQAAFVKYITSLYIYIFCSLRVFAGISALNRK